MPKLFIQVENKIVLWGKYALFLQISKEDKNESLKIV